MATMVYLFLIFFTLRLIGTLKILEARGYMRNRLS